MGRPVTAEPAAPPVDDPLPDDELAEVHEQEAREPGAPTTPPTPVTGHPGTGHSGSGDPEAGNPEAELPGPTVAPLPPEPRVSSEPQVPPEHQGRDVDPASPGTPDELTRVEQLRPPGRARSAWRWTRRAARDTQQALSVHVEGLEQIPAGAAILAANHVWAGDFGRIRAALDRPVRLADGRTGRLPRWRVPIDDPEHGEDAGAVLGDGGLVVVFPEGAPSPDGDVHRGGTDVAWLALTARVPVVPVGIVPAAAGPRVLEPLARRALGPTVIIGEPLDFSRFWEIPALSYALDGVLLRGVTDQVMGAIAALTGRTYVDTTPARAKELMADARRQSAWARAREYPTASQVRRAEAERREMLRERDEEDLARAVAEARARAHSRR